MDRPGHYVYLRDAEDGDYWSISWQPVGKPLSEAKYTCRHGMSYTTYGCQYKGIEASQTLVVPINDPVELWDVRLKNTTDKERKISVFSYLEFSYHSIMIDNQNFQMSLYCAGSSYEDGIIDSVDVVTIISKLEETFDISVTMEYIQPDYFQSVETMWEMVEELM